MRARTVSPSAGLVRRWSLVVAALPLACASGCSALGGSSGKNVPQLGVVDCNQPRELQMVSLPPYVVEPPDELEISLKPASPDLNLTTVTVQADGNIDLGFLGDVYVAGLTLEEVEQKVAFQFAAYTRRSTRVQVSARLVNGTQSKSYYVLGTVTTQGKFPVTGNETVLDAILTAGLRSNSMPDKAYLVRPRPVGAGCQILKIDWVGIKDRGDTLTNYQVLPGDRIVVPGGKPPGLFSTLFGGS